MRRNTDARTIWTLTVIRHGKQGEAASIHDAQFRFGRTNNELLESPINRLPSGLAFALEGPEIVEEALESGFVVQMRSTPGEGDGWLCFQSTVTVEYSPSRHYPGPSRTLYTLLGGEPTLELVRMFNPCSGGRPLSRLIWARAAKLPISTLAWAVENGIFEEGASRQLNLNEWIGPPADETLIVEDIMPLPGPSTRTYAFL